MKKCWKYEGMWEKIHKKTQKFFFHSTQVDFSLYFSSLVSNFCYWCCYCLDGERINAFFQRLLIYPLYFQHFFKLVYGFSPHFFPSNKKHLFSHSMQHLFKDLFIDPLAGHWTITRVEMANLKGCQAKIFVRWSHLGIKIPIQKNS